MKSPQSPTNKKLEAALKYAQMGISVIPWGSTKKSPLLKSWDKYQQTRATESEIRTWWRRWPNANPFGVMGGVSGIVMFDIDKQHGRSAGEFKIPPTACVKTPQGGNHFYFKHPGYRVQAKNSLFGTGVDFKGDGGLAALPGTVYNDGGSYESVVEISDGLAEMPDWLLEQLNKVDERKKWQTAVDGAVDGERNDTSASMAGKILHGCPQELWDTIGWKVFKEWNETCEPPQDEKDLKRTWNSIKKAVSRDSNKTIPDKLLDLVKSNPAVTLFKSDLDEPYVQLPVKQHKEHWPCGSKEVKLWLSREYWNKYKKAVNNDALNTALTTIQGLALFEGNEHKLVNRIANHDNSIYYSLSNSSWDSVKVNKDGWQVESNTPLIFRHYGHQDTQVVPIKDGNAKEIFQFINIGNEEHKVLYLVWQITAFIPDIPQPILYLYGPQGSAKSTVSRLIKKIIDPSQIDVSEIPKDQKELIQQLSHHRCLMFDNVSFLHHSLSDLLCRAVTGLSFSKRQLYSDDSDIIYRLKRCIGINGINLLAVNPDLLERSILIELERVSKENRKSEKELLEGFNAALPGILGGIFDVLSKAMSIEPGVHLSETPRMADFSRWGYAIAEALGYGGDKFLQYYKNNLDLQREEVLENSVEAAFIIELMENQDHWEGSPTDLLNKMSTVLFGIRDYEIPKTPQILSRRLNIIKTNLLEYGIEIEFISGQKRKVIVRKKAQSIAPIAPPSQEQLINDEKHENKQE